MPANKYALLRYRIIDRCLTNPGKPFPTKEDLRQACEDALYGSDGEHISISTVEKDLWAMRNEADLGFYAPIEYHRDERGYHYTEEGYSINDVQLNDDDLDAIRFATNTLIQFRDLPIFSNSIKRLGKSRTDSPFHPIWTLTATTTSSNLKAHRTPLGLFIWGHFFRPSAPVMKSH